MSHQREIRVNQTKAIVEQQENAAINYTLNWIPRLNGATISSSTWTAENSGSTIASEANTTTKTSARLSGTPGRYLFTNKITTSDGDTMEFQFELRVKDNDVAYTHDYRCGYH